MEEKKEEQSDAKCHCGQSMYKNGKRKCGAMMYWFYLCENKECPGYLKDQVRQ